MKRKLALSIFVTGVISIAGCGGASFLQNSPASAIAAVSVTCSPSSISSGGTAQCRAVVTGVGTYSSDVMWTVDSGTISSSGVYTAPSASGSATATVTATSKQDKDKSGRGVLNFGNPGSASAVSGVSVVANPSSLAMGQSANCNATVSGSGNFSTAVSWTATGGTISDSGVFTPSGPGSGTCTAYSVQDKSKFGTASINITSVPVSTNVTAVSVTATPSSINLTQTATCSANVIGPNASGNAVTWTATGGTITQSGVFTPSAVGTGTCTATSTLDSTKSATASINVSAAPTGATVTGITVIANPSSINTSQTATCVANVSGTGTFSNAVTWTATGGTITQGGVFTPSGAGTGTCTATSTQAGYTNVSGQATVNVTGSGTATLTVNSTTMSFGTVNLNTPATQSVTLTSTGTTAVVISGATVTGTGFSISGATFPLTLNPNQTVQLFVVFNPKVSGSATGQLTITSNSTTGATTIVGLTGSGQVVSYQVNLSWNAPVSTTDPVTGYNVFRAPTGTSTYQQLNTSAVTVTNYVDGNVQNGTTYDYVIRSVDASGATTISSNTYTAAVPQ